MSTVDPDSDSSSAESQPLRILLAEDNIVNQKITLRVLERMGHHADLARNGLEVLEALHRQPYDLVLMDIHMPEMDGFAATRQICQNWLPPFRPRIIAMTASATDDDRQECLKAGMDGYTSKPISIEELTQILHQCHKVKG